MSHHVAVPAPDGAATPATCSTWRPSPRSQAGPCRRHAQARHAPQRPAARRPQVSDGAPSPPRALPRFPGTTGLSATLQTQPHSHELLVWCVPHLLQGFPCCHLLPLPCLPASLPRRILPFLAALAGRPPTACLFSRAVRFRPCRFPGPLNVTPCCSLPKEGAIPRRTRKAKLAYLRVGPAQHAPLFGVAELARRDQDEIEDHSDGKEAQRKQPKQTRTDLADVEAVQPQES